MNLNSGYLNNYPTANLELAVSIPLPSLSTNNISIVPIGGNNSSNASTPTVTAVNCNALGTICSLSLSNLSAKTDYQLQLKNLPSNITLSASNNLLFNSGTQDIPNVSLVSPNYGAINVSPFISQISFVANEPLQNVDINNVTVNQISLNSANPQPQILAISSISFTNNVYVITLANPIPANMSNSIIEVSFSNSVVNANNVPLANKNMLFKIGSIIQLPTIFGQMNNIVIDPATNFLYFSNYSTNPTMIYYCDLTSNPIACDTNIIANIPNLAINLAIATIGGIKGLFFGSDSGSNGGGGITECILNTNGSVASCSSYNNTAIPYSRNVIFNNSTNPTMLYNSSSNSLPFAQWWENCDISGSSPVCSYIDTSAFWSKPSTWTSPGSMYIFDNSFAYIAITGNNVLVCPFQNNQIDANNCITLPALPNNYGANTVASYQLSNGNSVLYVSTNILNGSSPTVGVYMGAIDSTNGAVLAWNSAFANVNNTFSQIAQLYISQSDNLAYLTDSADQQIVVCQINSDNGTFYNCYVP